MEFQKEELDEILNIFREESSEIISSMDGKLLILEKDSKNQDIAMQLFRDAHSLKGSARMLGFDDIQNIAHKIEDIISLVRENKLVITSQITDTISECLEFILMLINETVKLKEEYKSPDIKTYLDKLETVLNSKQEEKETEENDDPARKNIIEKFRQTEEVIIDLLYIVSEARKKDDYQDIYSIEDKINHFVTFTMDVQIEEMSSFKNYALNILNSLDRFKMSDNKKFSFLELNNCITTFVEAITSYADKEHIKKRDYYEIVEERLNKEDKNKEPKNKEPKKISPEKEVTVVHEAKVVHNEKINEILDRLPLLELNTAFLNDFFELVNYSIYNEKNETFKKAYTDAKDILTIYKEKKQVVGRDVTLGLKELFNAVKSENEENINEALKKINVIKTMVEFEHRNKIDKKNETSEKINGELTQKEMINSISNTEIKTLRVDSIKLDNLVGQVGELIVSKIKTNEQLSLAKKINNELLDWQKNFLKMGYYIKYFDKKYLSNPLEAETQDYRKIIAYNRQLCTLSEQHQEKIANLIKEMQHLFKQLQESETKLNSTATEIETMVKNMRILPLSTIFQLFPRMVHNIARDKHKKIDLVINGQDITADKTIIEEIKIPLIHIIRNAIDHGIEDVETRKSLNKNPIGRIEIDASYKDNNIIIDVKDDGRGLDIEKIKQKALEKKLLTEDELNAINNEELTNLIFYPGFSTEDFVTELSGRGLGLDIVNNKINQMNGRIDIFSEVNKGTVVRIILPATVATKKVFIIEEQTQLYAIETSVIKTIVRVDSDEIFEKDNHNYYIYDGCAIVIYTLSQILNFKNSPRETSKYTLMIIEIDNMVFGIIVEKLISDQEIVHKKLAPPLYKVKHISGITTLANGETCLILNVSDIMTTINSKKIRGKIISKNGIIKTQDNSKYKILVLDDSHTTRMLQKNILTNHGYSVSSATNPVKALDKVRQNNYDLIVSDVQMPEMNGFEFITELRKITNYENTPVIVVSSEPKENYEKEIQETKVASYIEKNVFKQEDFISKIENILNY